MVRHWPLSIFDVDFGMRSWAGQVEPRWADHEKDPATRVECEFGERGTRTFNIAEALEHVDEDATARGELDQHGLVVACGA